jgi:hypothetical protein
MIDSMRTRVLWLALLVCVAAGSPLFAQVQLVPAVSGLNAPTFVTNARDGTRRLFILEQAGLIRVLQPGSTTPTTFLDIRSRVRSGGEQGLLGLAFHPLYPSNGRFFVYYTRSSDGAIVMAEYRVSSDRNVAATNETVLLTIPHPVNTNHNGGMLAFGPTGISTPGSGTAARPTIRRATRRTSTCCSARSCASTSTSRPDRRRRTHRRSRILSSDRLQGATRSTRTACAIPGASASIA